LQDWLLDNYDQKGLIIEVNPTSNVYIAKLKKHAEHPIFRWYPLAQTSIEKGGEHNQFGLRRGPIKVCINTDDPGIMPTTLRTEFALLRDAAIEHKATRTDAEAWLERIRQIGLREFHQKHQPVWVNR
jgi:adenosine deaminase